VVVSAAIALCSRLSPAQSARDTARTVGTATDFAVRIVSVASNPSRATFELARPAYVTVISVTETAIDAILPVVGMKQKIIGGGTHVASLSRQVDVAANGVIDRFGNAGANVASDDATADQIREYNRCLAGARQAESKRRDASRRVTGYDKDGKPIYGPASEPTIDYEALCRAPQGKANANRSPQLATPAKPGRYLLIYASDTPIEFRDITELTVTESTIRLTAYTIGKRLFGVRGAAWSGHIAPW